MESEFHLQKVLIAVEDSSYSDRATAYGFALAKKMGSAVALVHVNNMPASIPYGSDPLLNEPQVLIPNLIQVQEEAGKKLLDRISEGWGDDLNLFTFNRLGEPKDQILAVADEWGADMIILGTHGRTGFDHFISGSVAESVVRKAKCAVLIIPNVQEEEEH